MLRIVSVALTPILPDTAGKIRAQLDLPTECKWEDAYVWNGWGAREKDSQGRSDLPENRDRKRRRNSAKS